MKHVIMFSGGASSALAAERVLEKHDAILLFTDTLWEDDDNYRFMNEVVQYLMITFPQKVRTAILSDGRNPLQIFDEEGILGNDRVPVCSRILKSKQTEEWLKSQSESVSLYFGFDYKEIHRAERVTKRYEAMGVKCGFPLCEPPYSPENIPDYIKEHWGIEPPRMYALGFSHANCGGRCVRGKLQHWRHLLRVWPDRFKQMEDFEASFKGGRYTFLKDLSLKRLREEYEKQLDLFKDEDLALNVPCIRCI